MFAHVDGQEPVDVSVVLPAFDAHETVGGVVARLLEQRFAGTYEVIVVASADSESELHALPALPDDPRLRVERHVPRLSSPAARNLALELARGKAIAFTDADVIPAEDWLEQLSRASAGSWCVGGSIANGTPANIPGTVEYLVEFFDLTPARIGPSEHGATANLFMPRSLWTRYGPFPAEKSCGDTWITQRCLQDGVFRFEPDAVVHHLNRQRMGKVLGHQYSLGGAYARLVRRQGGRIDPPFRCALRRTVGRVVYLYRRLAQWTPNDLPRGLLLSPLVIAAFGSWGAGFGAEARRLRDACAPDR
jgi:glycosyltransferase involved in cell wall biosynthesis